MPAHGTRRVGVADPQRKCVDIYYPDSQPRKMAVGGVLTDDLLPGSALPVADLFEWFYSDGMFHTPGAFALIVCVTALAQGPAIPRNAAELEQRIASLPPAEQAYERFRFWHTQLPPTEQQAPDVLDKYRAHLIRSGRTSEDAGQQISAIRSEGKRAEIQRWNRILTSPKPRFNTEPNAFLVEMTKGRKAGTALDVGMGQGRNAIWLAQQGWQVTGFDPAQKAVALARSTAESLGLRLATEIKAIDEFDFGQDRWDLILLSYVGARGLTERVERALRPGGVVIIEGTHRDATEGRAIGGGVVFDTGELPKLFPGLRVVRYEEPMARSDFGLEVVRVVRYCGVKPE